MGVYIKGMDMPIGQQIIELRIYADGVVTKVHDRRCRKIAEATEVPEPHGRLIDADEFVKQCKPRGIANTIWEESHQYKQIITAPTIIERSK